MNVKRLGLGMALLAFGADVSNVAAADLSLCHANDLKRFIGKPLESLQFLRKTAVRYVCEKCYMTMDYRVLRLTVIYSSSTRRVMKLDCK